MPAATVAITAKMLGILIISRSQRKLVVTKQFKVGDKEITVHCI